MDGRRLGRRTVLVGGGAAVVAATGAALGVEQGVLPGRPWLQAHLGLNGDPGVVPDVEPGPVTSGSFVSEHRLGAETGWSILRPPGQPWRLPVVVALHGLGGSHETLTGPEFALDRYLAAAVAAGAPPFAIATVDGGTSYWHPRPSGDDASAMVVDELLPLLADHGLRTDDLGLMGWSMGGYGALRLAGLLGPERVRAVVAASPAIWTDPDDASTSGFDDAEEYQQYTVVGHQGDLDGIAVRIDCGTGDPFYRDVQVYADGFSGSATSTFQPGGHEAGYWRRMLPAELAFLGDRLGPGAPE
jgi:enterochelin esterase-like enzyme